MRTFNVSTDIAAPAERVWEVMIDTNRWHEWTPSITSVKRLSDAPIAVGSRVLIRQPKIPPASWTVTAIEPGASFTWVRRRSRDADCRSSFSRVCGGWKSGDVVARASGRTPAAYSGG